jgi:sulfatase maturation enzyme AslB (radical SAM superfamily)
MNALYKINVINRIAKSILLNQKPNYAIIYIDGRCNMHCGFCIHAAVDARKTPILSSEKWGSYFRNAKSLMHLTITGGEPFLRKDFFDIIDKILQKNNIPQVSINTNGFYIDRIKDFIPRLVEKYTNTEFTLSISLDGPEEIHDKVRVFKGAYKRALETIDAINFVRKNENFYLKLASVLTKDNNHFMEDFLNKTSKWNIDFHEIILVRDVPVEEQLLVKENFQKLNQKQHMNSTAVWKKSFTGKLYEKIYKETLKRIDSKKIHSPCLAGDRLVEVFPDGVVRGCEVEKLWNISNIGNLNEENDDIVKILKTKKAKEFSKFAKKCTCTFECASAINTVYDPKHWISLI